MNGNTFSNVAPPAANRWSLLLVLLLVPASLMPSVCRADEATLVGDTFTITELRLFGSSGDPLAQALGRPSTQSDLIGGRREDPDRPSKPLNLGEKIKAGALSLFLPGAGQYYNGQRGKAGLFAAAELGIWGAYTVFHIQGHNRSQTYREYANIYAGTSGDHTDTYWQSVGRYLSSDEYNESVMREARAFQESDLQLITGNDQWQWRNEDLQLNYLHLRADANHAYDHRDFMVLFSIINRAVAVFDAVRNAASDGLAANVLGMDVAVEVSPSLFDPTTTLVVSRGF